MDFTIIVPTFERPEALKGCLESLAALDYPRDKFEVIVVDDGGSQELQIPAGLPQFRLLRQQNQGPGAARNFGARHAAGRWLAFTDDDCRPHPAWLSDLRDALLPAENQLCGGRTENALTENPYAATSQLIADAAYRFFHAAPSRGRFLASNNIAVWRAPFLAAGGFDKRFRIASEDRELTARWAHRHGAVVWIDGARVFHHHHLNFATFLRQHYRYGQGAALYHAVRAKDGARFWDDVTFRARAVELLLRPALAHRRPLKIIALLIVWQLANTAGFLRGWFKARKHCSSDEGFRG